MRGKVLDGGSITSPRGFLAGGVYAGLKTAGEGVLDLGILYSQAPCMAAGVFTRNQVKAAPVLVSQRHLERGEARALVVNSGCANACTGPEGLENAEEMARLAAAKLGIAGEEVLVASTGVIGVQLPLEKIRAAMPRLELSGAGGKQLARAIVTTDTHTKEIAVSGPLGGATITIGGIAKGAGMIHPNMATLLSFLATDAKVEPPVLGAALQAACDASFNMITIDGDTSTNDTLLLFANGEAGNRPITAGSAEAAVFAEILSDACVYLAKQVAGDGEGATRLIEVRVSGAVSLEDARVGARTIAGSSLVKAAIHGNDPNWGRILAALGRSGAAMVEAKTDVQIGDVRLMTQGVPQTYDRRAAVQALSADPVVIAVALNLGNQAATAWGCDLSEEYVTFNSAYTT